MSVLDTRYSILDSFEYRVSSIVYRVSSIEYRVSSIEKLITQGRTWEERFSGDRFLPEVLKIKSGSCSVGNFALKLVQTIFLPEELADRNCSGRKGKQRLDTAKLEKVKMYVFKMYPTQPSQMDQQWKKCVVAIDEYIRRCKRKSNVDRQQ